jgi:hypothetical protein
VESSAWLPRVRIGRNWDRGAGAAGFDEFPPGAAEAVPGGSDAGGGQGWPVPEGGFKERSDMRPCGLTLRGRSGLAGNAKPSLPSTGSRRIAWPHDRGLNRQRHRVASRFGRLEDRRRIAMRHDRCADTFFSAMKPQGLVYDPEDQGSGDQEGGTLFALPSRRVAMRRKSWRRRRARATKARLPSAALRTGGAGCGRGCSGSPARCRGRAGRCRCGFGHGQRR